MRGKYLQSLRLIIGCANTRVELEYYRFIYRSLQCGFVFVCFFPSTQIKIVGVCALGDQMTGARCRLMYPINAS